MDLVRLYNIADVGVFTQGGFDGLNLFPYEFTASQGQSVPGALIISEFMGCSRSLNGVLRVNPWSLEAISDALHQGLSMSNDERRANHARRFHYVINHTVERWANGYLEQLSKATKLGSELTYHMVATKGPDSKSSKQLLLGLKSNFVHLPTELLTSTYAVADLRVILLDYDGTLVETNKQATDSSCLSGPPQSIVKLLKFLSEDPNTVVFLMSGRTRSVLTSWFGSLSNLGLAAEKGLFLRWPERIANACRFDRKNEAEETEEMLRSGRRRTRRSTDLSRLQDESSSSSSSDESEEEMDEKKQSSSDSYDGTASNVNTSEWECIIPLGDLSWKQTALEIIRAYTEQTDGTWIEDKEFAIVWHFEGADAEYGRMQSADLQKFLVKILARSDIDVMRYDRSRVLEVKPHGVNKGLAATAILESLWIKSDKEMKAAHPSASNAAAVQQPRLSPQAVPASRFGLQVNPPSTSVPVGADGLLSPRSATTDFHPFVLAIGDDRSDEEMFTAVQQKSYLAGSVRGRERGQLVDSFVNSMVSSHSIVSAVPQTPSNTFHDREISPTPMSPTLGGGRSVRHTSPPSTDPYLFTCCVGLKPSSAHFYLNSVEEVLRSLYGLVLKDQERRASSAYAEDEKSPRKQQMGLSKRTAMIREESESGLGPKRGSFGALASLLFNKKA